MKKILIVLILLFSFTQIIARSSSFLMPRSITHNATLELALDTYHIYRDPSTACSPYAFYATPFYMKSNNGNTIARYFLPQNDTVLDIQENGSGNIGSLWLNLVAPPGLFYSSTIRLNPISKTAGSYFYSWIDLGQLWYADNACTLLQNAWLSISFAVVSVTHNLNIKEELTGDASYGTIPDITTGIEAFNNHDWLYGKLSPYALKKNGVDDIQIKLGTNYYYTHNKRRIGLYLVGTIPTGKGSTSRFLFEPMVGTCHGAFGFGIMGDYTNSIGCNGKYSFLYDFKYRYLFSGREIRSFDLQPNGDWSRYMLLVKQDATSVTLPAINSCTLPVNVTPGSQLEYWLALHLAYCRWNIELGYNLWWRGNDHIKLLKSFPPDTGIFDLAGAVVHNPISASKANITQSAIGPNQAPSDLVFTPSHTLNLASGAQRYAIIDSIYLAFSYNGVTSDDHPWLIGIGGGYDFADHHTLAQGSVWGKLGILF